MINLYVSSYGEFDSEHPIGPVKWKNFDLIFVHDGEVEIEINEAVIILQSGQAILIYPDTCFSGHSISEVTRVSVNHFNFKKTDIGQVAILKKLIGKRKDFEVFKSPAIKVEYDLNRLIEISYDTESDIDSDKKSALLILILAELKSEKNSNLTKNSNKKFIDLITELKQRLSENTTLEEMAQMTNLSKSHFRALFKKKIGTGPGQYFHNLKMKEAARLLRETSMPIKEISFKVSYTDISHFYRAFSNTYKITPAKYRKKFMVRG